MQRHVRDLARGMPDITAGIALGSVGWLSREAAVYGIPVAPLRSLVRAIRPDLAFFAGQEIRRHADRLGATILHAHGVAALAAALFAAENRPLLYTPHGFQWRDPAHGPMLRNMSKLIHAIAIPKIRALVAVSGQDAADALALGFPRAVVHRIPNGVDIPPTTPVARPPATIGTAGRLVPGKGVHTLLEVVSLLPHTSLIIAGTGPALADLHRRCENLAIDTRVHWWGWQDSLDRFYQAITVYVSLSLKEGMPYSILDALAYGVPVVASDIPSHREILSDAKCGRLVYPQDPRATAAAIELALSDVHTHATRALCARQETQRFSLSSMLQAHRRLYHTFQTEGPGHSGEQST